MGANPTTEASLPEVPAPDPVEPEANLDSAPEVNLAQVRELILAAHPDVVPEMVAGASFEALMASIDGARGAYQRIAEQLRQQPTAPGAVPAGQPGRQTFLVNVEALSPSAKIAEGLRRKRQS